MSLNVLYYTKNFQASSGNDYLIRVSQAADAEEMQRVYDKNLAEITAINAAIGGPGVNDLDKFTPVDAMLAGAGDGHTFIYTVTLARTRLAAVQQVLLGQQAIPVTQGAPPVPGPMPLAGFPIPNSAANNPTLGATAAGVATTPPVPAITQPAPIGPFFVDPNFFVTRFAVASAQEEVQAAQNTLVDRIITDIGAVLGTASFLTGFYCPFQGIAGGAKGSRFMLAMTGVPVVRTVP
jgi:hypothetical protein